MRLEINIKLSWLNNKFMNTQSWFFSFLILVGTIFTVVGLVTYIFPPKKINYIYGYRTNSSMKSYERWRFAQRYSRRLMVIYGIVMMMISCLGLFYSISETVDFYIGISISLFPIILLFIKTEKAIKNKFPDNKEIDLHHNV